jgi:hypothetical protein
MSKTRNRSKDQWIRYKKLEEENKRLKKEVSKLRKLVSNLFVDHLEERSQRLKEGKPTIDTLCESCGNQDLKHIQLNRVDGLFNMYVCNSCTHRSEIKKVKETQKNKL